MPLKSQSLSFIVLIRSDTYISERFIGVAIEESFGVLKDFIFVWLEMFLRWVRVFSGLCAFRSHYVDVKLIAIDDMKPFQRFARAYVYWVNQSVLASDGQNRKNIKFFRKSNLSDAPIKFKCMTRPHFSQKWSILDEKKYQIWVPYGSFSRESAKENHFLLHFNEHLYIQICQNLRDTTSISMF